MKIESVFPFEEYSCYKVFHKKQKRWFVQLVSKTKRTTITYAKFLLSIKYKRILTIEEEVDHKDDNKLNDSIDNLQILTREQNSLKQHKTLFRNIITLICPNCKTEFQREKRQTHLIKGGKRTFCSRHCQHVFRSKAFLTK